MKAPLIDSSEGLTRYPVLHPEAILASHRSATGATYLDAGDESHQSACLRCPDRPCFSFADEDVTAPALGYLVSPDLRADVCPFGALEWAFDDGSPRVKPERCAGCGLCVRRCPVGAIGLHEGVAQVCLTSDLNVTLVMEDAAFYERREVVADVVRRAAVTGHVSDDRAALGAVERMAARAVSQSAFRLLARNALLVMGLEAQLSKVGDNHSRIELTFSDGELLGLAELDPGGDLLDASRRLLADVAHAIATRGVEADSLRPAIVCGCLPNVRTDVYNLLIDIEDVLGMSVAALPIVALVAPVMARCSVEEFMVLAAAYEDPESGVLSLAELTGIPIRTLTRGGGAPRK